MKYMKGYWIHQFEDEPVLYFHEIDEDGYERRRVQFYQNGGFNQVSKELETDDEYLSPALIPSVEEINEDPQFRAEWINESSFEEIWDNPRLGLAMLP